MQRMGIEALYRRPRTTKPEPGHKIYPYLLRGAAITRPNQVWAMDITYIPMARGFVYLAPGHGVKRSASDLRPRSRFEFNSNPSGGSFANREGHLHLSSCSVTRVEWGQTSVELYEPQELQRITRG